MPSNHCADFAPVAQSRAGPNPPRRQGGFSIVAAIFILVVLAALAGFIVSITTTQNLTFAQDMQGARALQAARAGAEYAIQRWLASASSANCPNVATPISMAGTPFTEFTVTVLGQASAVGGVSICAMTLRAVTTAAAIGSHAYAEREINVVVESN